MCQCMVDMERDTELYLPPTCIEIQCTQMKIHKSSGALVHFRTLVTLRRVRVRVRVEIRVS